MERFPLNLEPEDSVYNCVWFEDGDIGSYWRPEEPEWNWETNT